MACPLNQENQPFLAAANNKPIIGLPGHPASAMIIFYLFGKGDFTKTTGMEDQTKRI